MNQAAFHNALLNPDLPMPSGLIDPQGRPAPRRFAVYRNNVVVGLSTALEAGFPVLQRLLGKDFFTAMAGVYVRAHPPTSRMMMHYGQELPQFLGDFPPVQHLPYLPDVARLELALREAYHAADAAPIDTATLANLPPEALLTTRLRLSPALRVLRSDWPIHSIWQANTSGGPATWQAEDVAVLRPQFDAQPVLLAHGGAAFIAALQAKETIGQAVDAAGPEHDLTATLGVLLKGGAIVALWEKDR